MTSTIDQDAAQQAMRAALLAQGLPPAAVEAAVEAALAAAPRPAVYRMRQGVADAVTEMRRDLPSSVKTWVPYLQFYVDGLPDTCPCPCPACATGSCPCPGGAAGHHETCAMRALAAAEAALERRLSGDPAGPTVIFDLPPGLGGSFHRALCTRLLTPTLGGFWEQLDRLAAYVAEHGVLPTPKTDRQLHTWMTEQRRDWRDGKMTPRKDAALEAIPGWAWDPTGRRREARALVVELHRQGHSPAQIAKQLNAEGYRRPATGDLHTADSVKSLRWSAAAHAATPVPRDKLWQRSYQEVLDWVAVHGPLSWGIRGLPKHLVQWMSDQRRSFRDRRPRLTPERIALLEAVDGWQWTASDAVDQAA